jgi:hypothetical protein
MFLNIRGIDKRGERGGGVKKLLQKKEDDKSSLIS